MFDWSFTNFSPLQTLGPRKQTKNNDIEKDFLGSNRATVTLMEVIYPVF